MNRQTTIKTWAQIFGFIYTTQKEELNQKVLNVVGKSRRPYYPGSPMDLLVTFDEFVKVTIGCTVMVEDRKKYEHFEYFVNHVM